MTAHQGLQTFVDFWRSCDLDEPPFVHPSDVKWAGDRYDDFFLPGRDEPPPTDMRWFIESGLLDRKGNRFHAYLRPSPTIGRLETAKIIFLMTNPGLTLADHNHEFVNRFPEFTRALRNTLQQADFDPDYPHIFLNPQFAFHGGFTYWHDRFRAAVQRSFGKRQLTAAELFAAISEIAKKVACLEFFPYHSQRANSRSSIRQMPSAKAARDFVLAKLTDPEDTTDFVVMRSSSDWLGKNRSLLKVLPYSAQQRVIDLSDRHARSSHLTDQKIVELTRKIIIAQDSHDTDAQPSGIGD